MRKISLKARVKSYEHLTDCLERCVSSRTRNFEVMSSEDILDSFKNEKFLNQSLDKVKEQIVILIVDKFKKED